MKRKLSILIGIAACICAAIALFLAWRAGAFLPRWIRWEEKTITCPDGGALTLSRRSASLTKDGELLWQSEKGQPVQDVLLGDIDHDGLEEVLVLCWRRGRYGTSRPFWVKRDDKSWSQHIFIYDRTEDGLRPVWMASDIGLDAQRWSFDAVRRLVISQPDGSKSAWDWVSWGLSSIPLAKVTELRFAALGDNLIHQQIFDHTLRNLGGDFSHLFANILPELAQYDVISLNQETPFVQTREKYASYPRFGTPVEVGEAIGAAGFDIVSCATNHALDQGAVGIDLTYSTLTEGGALCLGIQPTADEAYRPYELLERNGIRCALFSYTASTNGFAAPEGTPHILHTLDDPDRVEADLAAGKAEADFCLVYVHWGTEYSDTPDEEQRLWAGRFADWGADVVIGTHPHVVQPVEWIAAEDGRKTLVFWSLGNFISAQTEESCRRGALAYFTLTKGNGACAVTDHGTKPLLTEVDSGLYTTRLLRP